jgi:hypothetical protein
MFTLSPSASGGRITPAPWQAWSKGNAVDWAKESFNVARREIYAMLSTTNDAIDLPDDDAASKACVVRVQMEKAGVRLAALSNRAFQ